MLLPCLQHHFTSTHFDAAAVAAASMMVPLFSSTGKPITGRIGGFFMHRARNACLCQPACPVCASLSACLPSQQLQPRKWMEILWRHKSYFSNIFSFLFPIFCVGVCCCHNRRCASISLLAHFPLHIYSAVAANIVSHTRRYCTHTHPRPGTWMAAGGVRHIQEY